MIKKGSTMDYSYLSIDQIRSALDYLESNYGLAMDGGAYGLADALLDKIVSLQEALVSRTSAEING